MKKRVIVSESNINLGERAKCNLCPVALALRDAFGENYVFMVSSTEIHYVDRSNPKSKPMTLSTKTLVQFDDANIYEFIQEFDNYGVGIPFEFDADLDLATPYLGDEMLFALTL